jgi:transposase
VASNGEEAGGSRAEVPGSFIAEFRSIEPYLDERQRRLVLAARAVSLGQGGAGRIARAVGVHPHTIAKGIAELPGPAGVTGKLRRPGGGRKRITEADPEVLPALLEEMQPAIETRPHLHWTTLSTRALAAALQQRGHQISAWSVAKLLRQNGFQLFPGSRPAHPDGRLDRTQQCRRVNDYVGHWLAARQPVITVTLGRAIPAPGPPGPGASGDPPDPGGTLPGGSGPGGTGPGGTLPGGTGPAAGDDTVTLAVSAIRAWRDRQPAVREQLLVVPDTSVWAIGSRAWRRAVGRLATDTGLTVSVCYLPPVTMRWLRISEVIRSTVLVQRTGQAADLHEVGLRVMSGGGSDARAAPVPQGPAAWNYTVFPAG